MMAKGEPALGMHQTRRETKVPGKCAWYDSGASLTKTSVHGNQRS